MKIQTNFLSKALIVVSIIQFCYCTGPKVDVNYHTNENYETIVIEPKNGIVFNLCEIIEYTRIIPLETNEECLIGNINRLKIFEGNFYILDYDHSKSIFVFNADGKFKFKISNTGKGPGEYIIPRDFAIDTIRRELIILDQMQRKLLTYNLEGDFIEERSMPFNVGGSLDIIDSEYYIFDIDGAYNEKKYGEELQKKLLITKSNNEFLFMHLLSAEWQRETIKQEYKIFSGIQEIIYTPTLVDTIFSIRENIVTPKYFIDFGRYKVNQEEYADLPSGRIAGAMYMSDNAYNIGNYSESKDYVFFSFIYKHFQQLNHVYFSKKEKTVRYFNELSSDCLLDLGIKFPRATMTGNEFIFVVEPHVVLSKLKELEISNPDIYNTLVNRLDGTYENLKENDNPVIVVHSIKF
jgi:hypothetical protein